MKKILLIEDDPPTPEIVKYSLQKAGFSIQVAKAGQSCVQKLAAEQFDLVIFDLGFPDQSGFDLLREIKNSPSTSTLPVILLSARGSEVNRVVGLELGAEDYIVSPFSPRELILRINLSLKICGNNKI